MKGAEGEVNVEVALPGSQGVDTLWSASQRALRSPQPEEDEKVDPATRQSDHDRNSRTNVVLTWLGSNLCVPDL